MLDVKEHGAPCRGRACGLVRREPLRPHTRLVDRAFEEHLGGPGVPSLSKVGVHDLPILVNRAVNRRPHACSASVVRPAGFVRHSELARSRTECIASLVLPLLLNRLLYLPTLLQQNRNNLSIYTGYDELFGFVHEDEDTTLTHRDGTFDELGKTSSVVLGSLFTTGSLCPEHYLLSDLKQKLFSPSTVYDDDTKIK